MPDIPPGFAEHASGLLLPTDIRAESGWRSEQELLSDPAVWSPYGFARTRSHAGQAVSPQHSMALAAYYACMRAIAEDVAKLPLQVLEQQGTARRHVRELPLWSILHDEFNEDMSAMTGRETMQHHVLGWGNAYALIERNRSMGRREGALEGLYPLHPSRVTPDRDHETGALFYHVSLSGLEARQTPTRVDAPDMLHLRGLGPDGLVGYSVCQFAAESLGLGLAAQEYGAKFFGNSATPSGVLKHPASLSPEAQLRLKESWLTAHGRDNQLGVAVLEEGMEFAPIAIPPEQAQLLQTRMHSDLDVCRWFRMPPSKIAILDHAHYNNMEQESTNYVVDTLLSWMVRWEQELDRKLLKGTPYYTKHDVRALLRGDQAARSAYYTQLFHVGAIAPNEIRAWEDLDPYDDGDEHYLQLNIAPVRQINSNQAQRELRPVERTNSTGPPPDQAAGLRTLTREAASQRNGQHHPPQETAYATDHS